MARGRAPAKKRPAKKEPEQLTIGAPAQFKDKRVAVADIEVARFGSPPDDDLLRSVAVHGVMQSVLLKSDGNGGLTVIDGRQRVMAAIENGQKTVPARITTDDGSALLLGPAITLAGNVRGHGNPVVELEAVEEIMRQAKSATAPAIARATGVPLKKVKDAIKLASIDNRLREAWLDGKFGTKVGVAAAGLEKLQQGRLVRKLEAEGKLTMDDIREVKRTSVRPHQRTLPGDRKYERGIEALKKVRGELVDELGSGHAAIESIDEAVRALEAEKN